MGQPTPEQDAFNGTASAANTPDADAAHEPVAEVEIEVADERAPDDVDESASTEGDGSAGDSHVDHEPEVENLLDDGDAGAAAAADAGTIDGE